MSILTIRIIFEADDALGIFHYRKVSPQENSVIVWPCVLALNLMSVGYAVKNYKTTIR